MIEGARPAAMSARFRLTDVTEVVIGRGKTRSFKFFGGQLAIDVPDRWMSSVHARITRQGGSFVFSDAGSTNGSMINGVPAESAKLRDGDILELGQTFFLFRPALPAHPAEPDDIVEARNSKMPTGLLSLLPSLSERFALLIRMVGSDAAIIINGPSGTGKEVAAKAIHELSRRRGEFVAVNCGGLPDSLTESEFFGYKKGAFSGAAQDHPGLVLAADKGTLFLDEIGDLPQVSQSVLLRVLQEREVRPVGSTKSIPVDFRLLCATHRDMEALIAEGEFREDLYARLSGFRLQLPALSERIEDLGLLISILLRDLGHGMVNVKFANDALRALIAYSWPRNIRELRAYLQTAMALAIDDELQLEYFPDAVRQALDERGRPAPPPPPPPVRSRSSESGAPKRGTTETAESLNLTGEQRERRERMIQLLREHRGNVSAVARAMGKARSQIQRWMRRYQLDSETFKTD
jgi:DNA-binding NtrC family response regulator